MRVVVAAVLTSLLVPVTAQAQSPPKRRTTTATKARAKAVPAGRLRAVPLRKRVIDPRIVAARKKPAPRHCAPGEVIDAKNAVCYAIDHKSAVTAQEAVGRCKKRGGKLISELGMPKKDMLKKAGVPLASARFITFQMSSKKRFKTISGLNSFFGKKAAYKDGEKAGYICKKVAAGTCRKGEFKDHVGTCHYASRVKLDGVQATKVCKSRGMELATGLQASLDLGLNLSVMLQLRKIVGEEPIVHVGKYDRKTKKNLFAFSKVAGGKVRSVSEKEITQATKARFLCRAKVTWKR